MKEYTVTYTHTNGATFAVTVDSPIEHDGILALALVKLMSQFSVSIEEPPTPTLNAYTVITQLYGYVLFTHQQAETPEQALLAHAIEVGYNVYAPQNIIDSLQAFEIEYTVCEGTISIASPHISKPDNSHPHP